MTNELGIPCCPRCLVEMADHDDELCPMLARVVEKSRHRDNFGKAMPVTTCTSGPKPECRRKAAGAERRMDDAGERQLPPADRRNAPESMAHKDQQSDWVSSGRGGNQNERMLEILWDGFVPQDPARLSRGRWVADAELIYQHRIGKPHSRAAELRGRTVTHESHPLVKLWRLDVDQSSDASVTGIAGSAYSICFIEHSERLRREREKGERGQETMGVEDQPV